MYAGSVHSCVLTREGTVYAFGKHEYTGHGDDEDVLEPRLIHAFSGGSEALVRQISVGPGGYHTMALTCQVGWDVIFRMLCLYFFWGGVYSIILHAIVIYDH